MKRSISAFAGLLFASGTAFAQPVQPPAITQIKSNPAAFRAAIGDGNATNVLHGDGSWGAGSGCTTNCTFGGVTAMVTPNATGPAGFKVTGVPVINLLSNQASPIVSPETQNTQGAGAIYFPAPVVQGYASIINSSTPLTYANNVTDNATVTGTSSNHYGMLETSLNFINGGSAVLNTEANQEKSIVFVPAGMTLLFGENKEVEIFNSGTVTAGWSGMSTNPVNNTTGTLSKFVAVKLDATNNNTTANTFQALIGLQCDTPGGPGSIIPLNTRQCVFNGDPNSVITTVGHYGARPTNGAVPVLTGCGTGPVASARSSDVSGTITEGTTATGCTITFSVPYIADPPTCVLSSPNGASLTGYSTTQSALNLSNLSSSGSQFSYVCMGGW